MGEFTGIAWTDHTFNPWIGCQEMSEACDFCYAKTQNAFRHWVDGWGPHGERRRTSVANWRKPITWHNKAPEFMLDHDRRQRVFCASLADVFDNKVPMEWRRDLWCLIASTPHLDWQLLTKRPENIAKMLPTAEGYQMPWNAPWHKWPWPNVWLGTTVENQRWADHRIPILLNVPAKVHFLSIEPMLGPIKLKETLGGDWLASGLSGERKGIGWAIIGGESGPHARPMTIGWAKELVSQCRDADVPCFVKQLGAHPVNREGQPHRISDRKGAIMTEWPAELRVQEFPTFPKLGKKEAATRAAQV